MAENDRNLIKKAKKAARFFDDRDFKDLYGFVDAYGGGTFNPAISQKGEEIMRYIDTKLTILNWAKKTNAHGLSINIPNTSYTESYGLLKFPKESLWGDFAKWLAAIKRTTKTLPPPSITTGKERPMAIALLISLPIKKPVRLKRTGF